MGGFGIPRNFDGSPRHSFIAVKEERQLPSNFLRIRLIIEDSFKWAYLLDTTIIDHKRS